jgi:hypothetical protein
MKFLSVLILSIFSTFAAVNDPVRVGGVPVVDMTRFLALSNSVVSGTAVSKMETNNGTAYRANINNVINPMNSAYGALGNGSTDDTTALQSAFNAIPPGGEILLPPNVTFLINSPILITNQNITIGGGGTIKAGTSFPNTTAMVRAWGTNISFFNIRFNASSNAVRALDWLTNSVDCNVQFCRFSDAYAGSTNSTIPYLIRIPGACTNIDISYNSFDLADTAHVNAITRQIAVTSYNSGEPPPHGINIHNNVFRRVGPAGDGDAICFQNNWTNNIGSTVRDNLFFLNWTGKSAVKIMVPGVTVDNNVIWKPAYDGVRDYGGFSTIKNNKIWQSRGDNCIEFGADGVSITNTLITENEMTMDISADISTTGDGIRANTTNAVGVIIDRNKITRARVGIYLPSGIHDSTITRNIIANTTQSAIITSLKTVGGTDYYPYNLTIDANGLSGITNAVGVSVIGGTNIMVGQILMSGNGEPVVFTGGTGNSRWNNRSADSIGGGTTQWELGLDGNWYVKNGASITNGVIKHLTLTGTDHAFDALGTNNFGWTGVIQNYSTGTNASAYIGMVNDLSNYVTIGVYSSAFLGKTNEGFFTLSTNLKGIDFAGSSSSQYWNFIVNGTNWFHVDGTGARGTTHTYGPSWDGSTKIPTEDDVYDKIETLQPLDADLTDLADGSLSGSKVGTGINGDNITSGTVADTRIASTLTRDSEWDTIAEIEAATGVDILVKTEIDTQAKFEAKLFVLPTGGGSGDAASVNTTAATDIDFTDANQIEWLLNTTPSPDQITARIKTSSIITNATSIGREIYLGTATNAT